MKPGIADAAASMPGMAASVFRISLSSSQSDLPAFDDVAVLRKARKWSGGSQARVRR